MADGDYGFDPNILDIDNDAEEVDRARRAPSASTRPTSIRADRITVDGTTLRYSDATAGRSAQHARQRAGLRDRSRRAGNLDRGARLLRAAAGVARGHAPTAPRPRASAPATAAEFANPDAFVLTDGAGANRYPDPRRHRRRRRDAPLTAAEVRAMLEEAFTVMSRARAQIRQPLDSRAQVTISVVDTHGAVLGMVRSPDAPIFGIDVSLQKARTAAFFSSAHRRRSELQRRSERRRPRFVAGGAHLPRRPDRADRQDRLRRPRRSATSRGPISPTARSAARRARSRARSRSSIPSRPGCSRR